MRADQDADAFDGRNETIAERSDRNWGDILQELRVTQTGTQIISGFLLTVAFQQRFPLLKLSELGVYLALISLAAASTILGLSIVSLHRTQFHRHEKPEIVAIASRLLIVSTVIVAVLTVGVLFFIFDFVLGVAAGLAAGVVGVLLAGYLLFVLPRSAIPRRPKD